MVFDSLRPVAFASALAAVLMGASGAAAQTPTPTSAPAAAASGTLQAEGIIGDVDKYHRSPLLTVSTQITSTGAKILADYTILDPVYVGYPVQVSFFINRKLFSTQYRSPELPGPLGVDVGKDVAPTPFNYAVVAMLLHPNRTFTTVIQGAVFGTELTKTYDCTLSILQNGAADPVDYSAEKITATQSAENTFELTFEGKDDAGVEDVGVKATVNVSGTSATAIVLWTEDDETTQLAMRGSVEKNGSSIEGIDLETSDGTQSLICSLSQ